MSVSAVSEVPHVAGYATAIETILDVARSHPIATSDRGVEILTYDAGQHVLNSPDFDKPTMFKVRLDAIGITEGQIREDWEILMPTTDGDLRSRLRVMFASMMRPAQVKKFTQTVREIVAGVFDELGEVSTAELMEDVVWKIPSRMYCDLVSAPYEFAPHAAELSDSVLGPIVARDASRRQESIDALYETYDIVSGHIERRRADLGDDFTSLMIRQEIDGKLSEREMVWNAVGLLHASIDNTVHQMGLVLGTILERRDVWAKLVEDPDLVPAAVEEAMRLTPRFNVVPRLARVDVEVGGYVVEAGTQAFVSIPAANRDPRVVDDPAEFRLDRPTFRTLQFGGGTYNCLGQHLARLEIQETLKALVTRFPEAALEGSMEVRKHAMGTEVARLPIVVEEQAGRRRRR